MIQLKKQNTVKVRPILWTYEPKKDGTCDVKIYISGQGRKSYISTGIKILPEHWNDGEGIVKRANPQSVELNSVIITCIRKIKDHFLSGGSWLKIKENKKKFKGDLISFFQKIIDEGECGLLPIKATTLKCYKSTLKRVREYSKTNKLYFEDIDMAFYHSFSTFLNDFCDCRKPGIGNHFKIIKRIMKLAFERDLHKNKIYAEERFKVYRGAISKQIFLTVDEIKLLEKLDLSEQPFLEKERDRWLIGYYFIMRFSDVCKISKSNLFTNQGQKFIRYKSLKTDTEVILPLSNKAEKILIKYDWTLNFSSNPQANKSIKIVAKLAGINDYFHNNLRGGSKNTFIKTHTGRRSGATNLHLAGCSTELIAKLGGWEKLSHLQIYLKSSALDNALIATKLNHFN